MFKVADIHPNARSELRNQGDFAHELRQSLLASCPGRSPPSSELDQLSYTDGGQQANGAQIVAGGGVANLRGVAVQRLSDHRQGELVVPRLSPKPRLGLH